MINTFYPIGLSVVDANYNPLPFNLQITSKESEFYNKDHDGYAEKIPVPSESYAHSNGGEKLQSVITFTTLDDSKIQYEVFRGWFNMYKQYSVQLNIPPNNTFPKDIHLDEDIANSWNLSSYFNDSEGSLNFDISTGKEISFDLVDTKLSLFNSENDWNGASWMNITASDGENETVVNSTVIVEPINDAPRVIKPLPELVIDEDMNTYINFTDLIMDPEDDGIDINVKDVENVSLIIDDENMNMTVIPDENWFGPLHLTVNISDDYDAFLIETITINFRSVNDPPETMVEWTNGTRVNQVEYRWNETTNITVYRVFTVEDVPVEFRIDAMDIEGENVTCALKIIDLLHGDLTIGVTENDYQPEIENFTFPHNLTYSPKMNDHRGDLVRFRVTDGINFIDKWLWFNVLSVNNLPVFNVPEDWNVTVDLGIEKTIDIADHISDVETSDDNLEITVDPSDHTSVNGTILTLLYDATFYTESEIITITISDGEGDISVSLIAHINQTNGDDDTVDDDTDDDDEVPDPISNSKMDSEIDKWILTFEGEEGQDIYLVLTDSDGDIHSIFVDEYELGKYRVEISNNDAREGWEYHFSDTEDGDSISPYHEGKLPPLIEEENDDGINYLWLILIAIPIIIVIILMGALLVRRGKKGENFEE